MRLLFQIVAALSVALLLAQRDAQIVMRTGRTWINFDELGETIRCRRMLA